MYKCISAECGHGPAEEKCGRRWFADMLGRVGDPGLLDDVVMLSETFPLSSKVSTTTLAWTKTASDADMVDALKNGGYRAAVIAVLSAMGIIVRDVKTGHLASDADDVDYGWGPGAAVHARAEWLAVSHRGAEAGVAMTRARVVGTVMASLVCHGMTTWAIDLFEFLTAESVAARRFSFHGLLSGGGPGDKKKTMIEARGKAVAFVKEPSTKAPAYAECLFIVATEFGKECDRRPETGDAHIDQERCRCGFRWLEVVDVDPSGGSFNFCPITTVDKSRGCAKWWPKIAGSGMTVNPPTK